MGSGCLYIGSVSGRAALDTFFRVVDVDLMSCRVFIPVWISVGGDSIAVWRAKDALSNVTAFGRRAA